MEVWGAAPRPGRAKFALHPRHVLRTCLSGTRWGPSPTLRGAQEVQEIHETQERPQAGDGRGRATKLPSLPPASRVRQHALNLQPICEPPKVFRAKRRNICGSPNLAVLPAGAGP